VTESSRLCIPPDPITAALSSMNTDLYLTTRMIFSLARNNEAPRASSAA
jgi:L-asparagine transporter-like permease